jgi:hypothetical protein
LTSSWNPEGADGAKELSPEDKGNVAGWDRPSWPQEGRLRHEQKDSHLIAAAGWWINHS